MGKISIKLNNKEILEFESGITAYEILRSIYPDKGNFIAVSINGRLYDLTEPIKYDCEIHFVKLDDVDGIEILRHSTSHVMAKAVKDLFPDAKLAIGPAIENGFYYDFDYEKGFTIKDLYEIEKRMREIIEENIPFIKETVKKHDVVVMFNSMGEIYKLELLEEIEDEEVTIYRTGDFVDLCRGPHIPSTGYIRAFKLLSMAGAYWRGSESNKMLQRIYGTAFPTEEELEDYLRFLEDAKEADHRKIGKDLDLFSIQDEAGAGLIFWHPKGAMVRKIIEDFWKEQHIKNGYEIVYTPHIASIQMWETSGHLQFYKENMYSPIEIEGQKYILKPMNCPGHILIYKRHIRSYRDLPVRFAELGTVYRYERSGVLHGLLRVRGFTQDDAHIFCRQDQLEDELVSILRLSMMVLGVFGFSQFRIFVSTRPEKFVGSIENWEKATAALEGALEREGLEYSVDPGEGVFYGPKIDIKIKDSLGRFWQCSTIQVDFNLPERFDVNYVGYDGKYYRPIMIHRALMGSLERFFGILIEHYRGSFPVWISPIQVTVMSITDAQKDYAEYIAGELMKRGLRTKLDTRNEKLSYKIREAEVNRIPYMVVVGNREKATNTVNVRRKGKGNLGSLSLNEFVKIIKEEIERENPYTEVRL